MFALTESLYFSCFRRRFIVWANQRKGNFLQDGKKIAWQGSKNRQRTSLSVNLKAQIIHRSLNPCGGGERLSLEIMQAISDLDIEFEISTLERPNSQHIECAFGPGLASVLDRAESINVLASALAYEKDKGCLDGLDYDLTINTHGDAFPYYKTYFSKFNSIVQCHFPVANKHIERENWEYLEETKLINLLKNGDHDARRIYFQRLKKSYDSMLNSSLIITNSEFSKKAIFDELGLDAQILSPPIDINKFRNALYSDYRLDVVLVLSRIVPYKRLENAVEIAKILKQKRIGRGMRIIGNLYDDAVSRNYYSSLLKMIKQYGLNDYISFEVNASVQDLVSAMARAKIYLHTMPGESFGMSIAEAMSAGLIPVVPHIGGQTEFVPKKYLFDSIDGACEIISKAFDTPRAECYRISDIVTKFSSSNYRLSFQRLVKGLL